MKYSRAAIWTTLRDIQDVIQPILTEYRDHHLPLDATAHRIAAYLRAALEWKAQHRGPQTINLRELSPEDALAMRAQFVDPAASARLMSFLPLLRSDLYPVLERAVHLVQGSQGDAA